MESLQTPMIHIVPNLKWYLTKQAARMTTMMLHFAQYHVSTNKLQQLPQLPTPDSKIRKMYLHHYTYTVTLNVETGSDANKLNNQTTNLYILEGNIPLGTKGVGWNFVLMINSCITPHVT